MDPPPDRPAALHEGGRAMVTVLAGPQSAFPPVRPASVVAACWRPPPGDRPRPRSANDQLRADEGIACGLTTHRGQAAPTRRPRAAVTGGWRPIAWRRPRRAGPDYLRGRGHARQLAAGGRAGRR